MELKVESLKKYTVLRLTGKHESNSEELMAALQRMWKEVSSLIANGHSRFVVDLSDCEFITSSVISLLVQTAGKAGEKGGWVKIILPENKSNLRQILELVGMHHIAPIFDSVSDLLRNLGKDTDDRG